MDLDKKYREKIQYILKETPNYTDKVFELEILLKQYHREQCNIDSVVKRDLKYKNHSFTDGTFMSVWVECNGEKIATFNCNYDNYEIAKNNAKILADTLNAL